MEHYCIDYNQEPNVIGCVELVNGWGAEIYNKHFFSLEEFPVYYVKDNGKYVGCVGRSEFTEFGKSNRVNLNMNSTYLIEGEFNDSDINRIFDSKKNITAIPVLNKDREILYEIKIKRDKFYQQLNWESFPPKQVSERERPIIVSLTSYGQRINKVHIAIKSLLYQTMRPDEIVLYLDEEKKIEDEEKLSDLGVKIVRGIDNLGPHKKYFFSMQDYPDALIITADDDLIYDDCLIEDLYKYHLIYPKSVIGKRGHRFKVEKGHLCSYSNWLYDISNENTAFDVCITGGAGTLYPVGTYRKSFLDKKAIIDNCLYADDIWMLFCEQKMKISRYAIGNGKLRYIRGTQDTRLSEENLENNRNDQYIEMLQNYFGICWDL